MTFPAEAGLSTTGDVTVTRARNMADFRLSLSEPLPEFASVKRGSYWKLFRLPFAVQLGSAPPPASPALTSLGERLWHLLEVQGLILGWTDRDTVTITVNYGKTSVDIAKDVEDTLNLLTKVFDWSEPRITRIGV